MDTVVKCGNCGTVLDERSDTPPEQREPCPSCGSTRRTFEGAAALTMRLQVSAAGFVETFREFSRRHPWWTVANLVIIVVSSVSGQLVGGVVGVIGGIAIGVLVYFLVPSGVEKVVERRRA